MTEHSPLGGSGTHRFIECPGSVGLSYGVEDEDDTFSAPGQAAHTLAEICLSQGKEAWEFLGQEIETDRSVIVVDQEMVEGVTVYTSFIREEFVFQPGQPHVWIEQHFKAPTIHKYCFSTVDFGFLSRNQRKLSILDFKYGAGIVVEAERNPQEMYYAAGFLEEQNLWDSVDEIELIIVQPRAFHWAGPIRRWTTTAAALGEWTEETLIPAMNTAMVSRDLKSGDHCRFCPAATRACPQLARDMSEMEKLMKEFEGRTAEELTNEQLSRFAALFDVAKIVAKKTNDAIFNRLMANQKVAGRKLVSGKADRQWKPEAEAAAKNAYGADAYSKPALLSPAQIEKQLVGGKAFAAQYAFKPPGNLTVAPDDDPRREVSRDTKSLFTNQEKGKK